MHYFVENMKKDAIGLIFFGIYREEHQLIIFYLKMHCIKQDLTKKKIYRMTKNGFAKNLRKKVTSLDWKVAKRDVENFLRPEERKFVESWSKEFFQKEVDKIELVRSLPHSATNLDLL